MNFCPFCGNELEFCGFANWNTNVQLSGCPKCDRLWEEHVREGTPEFKKSFMSFSQWQQQRRNETLGENNKK